jgi:hypothetical protein
LNSLDLDYSIEQLADPYDALILALRNNPNLVVKPVWGSHGNGFKIISFINNKYYLNNSMVRLEDITNTLKNMKEEFLVTEYIKNHDKISLLYSGSLNTLRVVTLISVGGKAILAGAYLRCGTSASGVVDNIGKGGIAVKIGLDNGMLLETFTEITGNRHYRMDWHPDTGQQLVGWTLPHWGKIKESVIEISEYLTSMRCLAFDIAITQEDFKITEINSHGQIHILQRFFPNFKKQFLKFALDDK